MLLRICGPGFTLNFVTILLIIINTAVFWFQLTGTGSIRQSVILYGMIPYDLFDGGVINIPGRIPAGFSIITSMFLHGGFIHLGTNMLYLWIFGRNVEDDFGHGRFLVFYLVTGIIAAAAFAIVVLRESGKSLLGHWPMEPMDTSLVFPDTNPQ